MPSALLIINTTTYFTGLVEVGRLLQKKSPYKPIFYFTQPYGQHEEHIALCEKEGMQALCSFKKVNIINRDATRLTRNQTRIKKGLLALYRNFWVGFVYEMLNTTLDFFKIDRLLKRIKPSLLILAGDNIGYNAAIFVKLGHKQGIPSAIIPLWMTNANEPAEAYYSNPAYDGNRLANRIVGWLDPQWTMVHRGKKLIRWPAFKIVAMKLFGLVPPLPWILNSSHADVIFAAHRAMEKLMQQVGIRPEQIKLTGSIIDDIMADNIQRLEARRKALYLKLGLSQEKPFLLCALPPQILYVFTRLQCDFSNYKDLVEFWIKSLAKVQNHHVVVSLHPAAPYEDMKTIEEWGVKIAREKIVDLIPLCDIFVASMSATINFAVACGKPTINYDVYRFRDVYWKFKGVLDTEEKEKFVSLLRKITGDKRFFSKVVARQQSEAAQCGMLDGKCGERILECINELAVKSNA